MEQLPEAVANLGQILDNAHIDREISHRLELLLEQIDNIMQPVWNNAYLDRVIQRNRDNNTALPIE